MRTVNKFLTMLALLLTAATGAQAQTTYTVTVKNGTDDADKWTVNPNPATEGQTVTVAYSGTKYVKSVKAVKKVSLVSITLNKTAASIYAGTTETLSVSSVTPTDATEQTVTWSSNNTSVATVDASTGNVTAVAAGTANITATANDGSGVTATCAVTVLAVPQYANQLKEATKYTGDLNDAGFCTSSSDSFKGKVISADEAKALAAYKKAQTGNATVILYGMEGSELYYAKDDGTTNSIGWYYDIPKTVLNGYKLYCVKK